MHWVSIIALFTLTGCITVGPSAQELAAEQDRQMEAAYETCKGRYPVEQGNRANRARCVSEAATRIFGPGNPYPDLLNSLNASRVALAARVDRGELKDEDARAIFAAEVSKVTSEAHRRAQGEDIADSQRRAASAATWSAIQAGRTRTCNRIGNSVTCY